MKIYLIGMMGSGKTTLGHQLAKSLRIPFVDLDDIIEKHVGKPVRDIFSESGEDYFRQIESELLHAKANSPKSFVMATGGGAPCFLNGIEIINQTGTSIFLNVPVPELIKRLEKDQNRPLLQNSDMQEKLTSLLNTRLPIYTQAHIQLSGTISLKTLLDRLQPKK